MLVVNNPGGLWGISREQLGKPGGKSAVNEFLYEICKLARTVNGARLIEGEGGGIREVQAALKAAGMSQPTFSDTGVAFTAMVPRHALLPAEDLDWLSENVDRAGLSDVQRSILVSMRHGEVWTNGRVRAEYAPIDSRDARSALQGLVSAGFAQMDGDLGQASYGILPQFASPADASPDPRVSIREPGREDDVSPDQEPLPEEDAPLRPLTKNGPLVLKALEAGPRSKSDVASSTGLTEGQVGYALAALTKAGLVEMLGRWGDRTTTYRKR